MTNSPQQTIPSIEAFGGLDGIKKVLLAFYRRVFTDPMIGYLFQKQSMEQLVERETQWTAKALGVKIEYQGQPLAKAHQKHPIRRGHFHRRNQLLFQTLEEQNLPKECILWWKQHSLAMERAILGQAHHDQACEQTANKASATPTIWNKA